MAAPKKKKGKPGRPKGSKDKKTTPVIHQDTPDKLRKLIEADFPEELQDILTAHDRLFLHHFLICMNANEASRRTAAHRGVKYTKKTSITRGAVHLAKLRNNIDKALGDGAFFEMMGLGLGQIASTFLEAMNANQTRAVVINTSKVKKVNGKNRIITNQEVVRVESPDHLSRVKAAEAAAKLRGEYSSRDDGEGKGPSTVNVVIYGTPGEWEKNREKREREINVSTSYKKIR